MSDVPTPADLTFLSPPGQIADWRMVVLWYVVVSAGLLEELPGTTVSIAARLDLDPHALRVVLDALTVWGVVSREADGTYAPGPDAPTQEDSATLRHHARALRRWSASVGHRLRGEPDAVPVAIADPGSFHDALAVTARQAAPTVVDACLARFPYARSVLDLGGLHGEYSLEFARRGLRATMQDLPPMIEVARQRGRLAAAGVELFEGSFFDTVPDGPFDLAFCSGITHTFPEGPHEVRSPGRRPPRRKPGWPPGSTTPSMTAGPTTRSAARLLAEQVLAELGVTPAVVADAARLVRLTVAQPQ